VLETKPTNQACAITCVELVGMSPPFKWSLTARVGDVDQLKAVRGVGEGLKVEALGSPTS